jgi:hypothetical protein
MRLKATPTSPQAILPIDTHNKTTRNQYFECCLLDGLYARLAPNVQRTARGGLGHVVKRLADGGTPHPSPLCTYPGSRWVTIHGSCVRGGCWFNVCRVSRDHVADLASLRSEEKVDLTRLGSGEGGRVLCGWVLLDGTGTQLFIQSSLCPISLRSLSSLLSLYPRLFIQPQDSFQHVTSLPSMREYHGFSWW